jgi:hypothetical protein
MEIKMLDYNKLAKVDNLKLDNGKMKVGEEEEDPWELIVPEMDYDDEKNSNQIADLSYKAVKLHQYRNHPRDRHKKDKFNWWRSDISFLPFWIG